MKVWLAIFAAALLVAGCGKAAVHEAKPRPVRVMTVAEAAGQEKWTFSGEVRSRHEARIGFRVPGKVLARYVDAGDRVRRGTLLAELDPTDYQHARAAVAAQLDAARAEAAFARDERRRHRELFDQSLISAAELERRDTAFNTAANRVKALEAQLRQAENQVAYTRLVADGERVVTFVNVEAGQVVTAGQPVFTLARLDEREVLIGVPEERLATLRPRQPVSVRLAAKSGERVPGRIREISPSAEPGSRTYAVRVSLKDPPRWVALGMTAEVIVESNAAALPAVPLAALFEPQSAPGAGARVWLYDELTGAVKSTPVRIERLIDGERVLVDGLQTGQRVIVAGASRLREGQAVRVLGADDVAKAGAAQLGASGESVR